MHGQKNIKIKWNFCSAFLTWPMTMNDIVLWDHMSSASIQDSLLYITPYPEEHRPKLHWCERLITSTVPVHCKANWLILFTEVIAIYCKNQMTDINALCWENAEFLNINKGGTCILTLCFKGVSCWLLAVGHFMKMLRVILRIYFHNTTVNIKLSTYVEMEYSSMHS